jgi:hypothetical protein
MINTAYVDTVIDLTGRRWYVNDRVLHTMPGIRSDLGRISRLSAGAVVRCVVTFDADQMSAPVYFSELALVGRRTAEEMPCAASEPGAVVYCEHCNNSTHPGEYCPQRITL